jgi:hypothetical protein
VVLNDRERLIALVVGGVVVVAGLFYGTDALYFGPKARLQQDITKAIQTNQTNEATIRKGHDAYTTWASLSVPTDPAKVEQPTRTIIFQLAQQNNFQISGWNNSTARGVPKQPDFQEVTFSASANTTTSRLGRFLATLESQRNMAVRIDSLTIESRKPGADDLHVTMTIRALVYLPKTRPTFNTDRPPATGAASRPANLATNPNQGPIANGRGPIQPDYTPPAATYNILNAPLGSLDPGLPLTDETPMDDRLKARREYQLAGKTLPKPRFGDAPVELKPGESMEQAMARRKAEMEKVAETQAAALEEQMKKDEAARLKAIEDAAPKLLPGETMEQYLIRQRQQQDAVTPAPASAPATAPDMATTTVPATAPANGGVQ